MTDLNQKKQRILKVVWTFLKLIGTTAAINLFFWMLFAGRSGREIILLSQIATCLLATPIIVHFLIVVFLNYRVNTLMEWISRILLVINILMLIAALIIIFIGCMISGYTALSFLYWAIGFYVYFQTIQLGQHKIVAPPTSTNAHWDNPLLDDDFMEEL